MFKQTPFKRVLFVRVLTPLVIGLFGVVSVLLVSGISPPKIAADTNSTVNFQARLLNSAGAIVPDGDYNVEFKLYNAQTGGSLLWTEDYLNSNSTGVRVADGYLTVNLGSNTPFPATIDWSQQLWLTMNIGGTGGGSFPSIGDGEMSPRIQLTGVPYAFSAGELQSNAGGFSQILQFNSSPSAANTITLPDASGTVCLQDSTNCGFITTGSLSNNAFVQGGNSFGATATIGTKDNFGINFTTDGNTVESLSNTGQAIFENNSDSTIAFQVQNHSGNDVLDVDTSNGRVGIGTNTPLSALDVNGGVAIGSYAGTTAAPTNGLIVSGNVGIGVADPSGALSIANGAWITGANAEGTGFINLFSINSNDEIQAGAAIDVDGGIVLPNDAGQVTFSDLPVDSSVSVGTPESYTFRVGSSNALTVYGEADGSGGIQNVRVAVGSSITPAYTLDVGGDVNTSGDFRINGVAVCTSSGCTSSGGSGDYIQDGTNPQTANFNITGNGTIGGTGTIGTLSVTNNATVDGTLGVTGITTLSSSLSVANNITSTSGVLTIQGTGTNTLSGGLSVGGSALFKPSSNSTTAFQIQPASSGTSVLDVDTANGRIGVDTNTPAYALDVNGYINSNSGVLVNGVPICTTSGCTASGGSGNYIQNGTTTQASANFNIQSTSTSAPVAVLQGANGQTADILDIQSWNGTSATTMDSFAANGTLKIGNIGTSTGQLYVAGQVPSSALASTSTGTNPYDTAIYGNYAYVTNEGSASLSIFDISNPASPVSLGSVTTGSNPIGITIAGHYAYVVDYGSGKLQIFDLSNPTSPVSLSTVGVGTDPRYVAVSGRYAYVTDWYEGNFVVVDVSNPAAPVSVATLGLGDRPFGIAVQGNYAYVANQTLDELQIINISSPANPTITGAATAGTNPYGVAVQGRYAYVANYGSNNIQVFDVSDPATPTSVTTATTSSQPYAVTTEGRYAYVVDYGASYLQVFDISNPATPASVGTVTIGSGNNPNSVTINGRYAYVTNQTTATLQTFDLGGEYTQSLQAGSAEISNLTVDSNATVNGNESIAGGLNVGGTEQVSGDLGVSGSVQVANGNLNLAPLAAPGAPTVAVDPNSGNLDGNYYYAITYVTAAGETNFGTHSAVVAPADNEVDLSNIPTSPSSQVIARNIYRTVAGGSSNGPFYLVATLNDDTTTTYIDNVADGSLGVAASNIDHSGGQLEIGGSAVLVSYGSNLAIGSSALLSNTTGADSVAVGENALKSNTTGDYGVAVGVNALLDNTTGSYNTAQGYDALNLNSTGNYNVAVGGNALTNNTASSNTAVGYAALIDNTSGTGNVALGFEALEDNVTGTNNTATGYYALRLNTGGSNTANGYEALFDNTSGSDNVAMGFAALLGNSTGGNNIAIGNSALYHNSTGSSNSVVGQDALDYNTTGSYNTVQGYEAAFGVSGNSDVTGNSLFGYEAGYALQDGANYNTLLGYTAGKSLTTGANNILIGYNVQAPSATGSNQLDIGNLLYGDLSADHIGINTSSTPTYTLTVNGSANATTLYQNGNQVCDNSNNCGYAIASGSTDYIQNQNASPQTANFDISGSGTIGGTATAGALSVTGTSTLTGQLAANGGIVTNNGTINSGTGNITSTGTVQGGTVNATTALQTAGTTRIDSSGDLSNIGTYNGSGNITSTGGVLTIQGTGSNTFSGNLVVNNNSGTTTVTGYGLYVNRSAAYIENLYVGGTTYFKTSNSTSADTTALTLSPAGVATFGNNVNTPGNFTSTGGILNIQGSGVNSLSGSLSVAGNVTSTGGVLTVQGSGTSSFAGALAVGTTSVGSYKLNVAGSANATTLYQNGNPVCDNTDNCGYESTTGNDFVQNTTSPQTANFNITGNGVVGGTLETSNVDTAGSGGTLNIGTTNAATVNVGSSSSTITVGGNQENLGNLDTPYGGLGEYGNMLTNSETIGGTGWSLQNSETATQNATTAPNGQGDASELMNGGHSSGAAKQTITTSSLTTPYTFSLWAKPGNSSTLSYGIYDDTASVWVAPIQTITLASGWQRYITTGTPTTAGDTLTARIYADGSSSSTSGNYNYVWGAQVVNASNAGVYTTTGSFAVALAYGSAVDGSEAVSGNVSVGGTATIATLSVTGAGSINGNLTVDNGATGNGTLQVGTGADTTTSTQRIVVDSNGYAGLQLEGDSSNAGGEPGGAYVSLSQDGGGVAGILGLVQNAGGDGSGGSFTGTIGNSVLLGNKYNSSLQLGTDGAVRLTISGTGNVGIDTTSTGTYALNVGGSANATTLYQNGNQVCDNSNNCGYAIASGSTDYIQNQNASPQTANFDISGSGTIGGTATAGALSVTGTSTLTGQLAANGGIVTNNGTINSGTGNITSTGTVQGGTVNATTALQTAGTTRIDSSGDLSNIGTYNGSGNITSTGGVLTIQGTGTNALSGNLTVGGTLGVTGATTLSAQLNANGGIVTNNAAINSGSGNITSTGTITGGTVNATSALQTDGTTRVDSSGDLVNIGNVTGSGTLQLSGTSGSSYIMSSLGLGVTNPTGALTIANSAWINSINAAGSGYVNILSVNSNDEIQLGAALNIDGGIVLPTDAGQVTFSDLPIDSSASAGTPESYTFRVGSSNALTVYGEADGSGGVQNIRVAVGSSITPAYTLDVGGDINTSGVYRVNGTPISSSNLSDASNLAKLNGTQTFTGTNTFNNAITAPTLQNATTLSVDTTNAGTLNLGSTNATTINLGGGSAAEMLNIGNSSGNNAINIGTAAGTDAITIGSSGDTTTVGSALAVTGTSTLTGQLAANGGIVTNNGTINTGSGNITSTGTVQGGTINATTALQTNGTTRIDSSGDLSNIGTYNGSGNITSTGGVLTIQGTGTNSLSGSLSVAGSLSVGGQTVFNGSGILQSAALSGTYSGAVIFSSASNSFTGNGSGLTALNGSNILSGTVGNAYLTGSGALTVTAGNGLTGGGSVALGSSTTLTVGAGSCITVGSTTVGVTNDCVNAATLGGIASSGFIQNTTSAQSANIYVQAATSGSVAAVLQANAAGSGDILDLKNGSGTTVLSVGSTGSILIKPSSNSTTAFQIQPAASSVPVFNVDTTNGRIGINTSSPAYALDVNGDINSNTAVRVGGVSVCTISCTPAGGSGNYIQNSTVAQTNANFNIRSASSSAVVGVLEGASGQTADLLDLQSWNGSSTTTLDSFDHSGNFTASGNISSTNGVLTLGGSGTSTIAGGLNVSGSTSLGRTSVNYSSSTTAFQVSGGGVNYLTVDTYDGLVSIGTGSSGETTPKLFVLDNYNGSTYTGDPVSAVSGAMYYNQALQTFRCGFGTTWLSCFGGLVYANDTNFGLTLNSTAASYGPTAFSDDYTIPAYNCVPGRVYRVTASGVYSSTGSGSATPDWSIYLGSTKIGGASVIVPSPTTAGWEVTFDIICGTGGPSSSAPVDGEGLVQFGHDAVTAMYNSSTINVNTTTSQTLQLEMDWTNSGTSVALNLRQFIVEALGP